MNYKKIANANFEEVTRYTSRDVGGRPLSNGLRTDKRARNRAAKREESRIIIKEALEDVSSQLAVVRGILARMGCKSARI